MKALLTIVALVLGIGWLMYEHNLAHNHCLQQGYNDSQRRYTAAQYPDPQIRLEAQTMWQDAYDQVHCK